MESYKKLLLASKAWVEERLGVRKDFFERLSKEQKPEFLWIGCSDSRVPVEDITGAEPGEIFVHRNIANLVVPNDTNAMSVVEFAVRNLGVKHIVVCGHYGCGGVQAAASGEKHPGFLEEWLQNIREVHSRHKATIELIPQEDEQIHKLVEINVMAQVQNLAKSEAVQQAWKERNYPYLHGWVFNVNDGKLRDLVKVEPNQKTDDIYIKTDLSAV